MRVRQRWGTICAKSCTSEAWKCYRQGEGLSMACRWGYDILFFQSCKNAFCFNTGWFLCQCMSREEMARRRAEDATEGLLHTADQMDTLPQRYVIMWNRVYFTWLLRCNLRMEKLGLLIFLFRGNSQFLVCPFHWIRHTTSLINIDIGARKYMKFFMYEVVTYK